VIDAAPAYGAVERASAAAARFGPPHAAERKLVTILFADVKGSMELSGSIELEEWWCVIEGVLEDMCEGVSLFGGWVEGFKGDGIMAVFDDSEQIAEHAHRACEAALWLQEAMRHRARELWREYARALSVRIGVNTGVVLVGMLGHRHGQHYTANGYAVALAKRMETLATPGRICLSEHTAACVRHERELRDLGAFEVKGATTRVRAFELTGKRIKGVLGSHPGCLARGGLLTDTGGVRSIVRPGGGRRHEEHPDDQHQNPPREGPWPRPDQPPPGDPSPHLGSGVRTNLQVAPTTRQRSVRAVPAHARAPRRVPVADEHS
jgi:class 3 adenylate cyclase